MNDTEFLALMDKLKAHLEEDKVFIKNPERFAEVERATEIAAELFSDSDIEVADDPLQMGALIVRINGFDIIVRGTREIELFQELISMANNFEIYATENKNVMFALVFNNALTRIA